MTRGLEVAGLRFRYPGATDAAVRDLSLSIAPGEVLAVVGPSGSGKSTLLRLLSGLLEPTGGRIHIAGVDVTPAPPERRPVAMVFQGFALFPHLSVRDNIGFGMRVRRVARHSRDARVAEVASRLRLERLLDRLPGELSGGERQRVALARALVRDPVLFLLDEPLSSLDPVLRTEARRELDLVLRAEGRCALYVTHEQSEAMTMGDRVAVLRAGALEQVATPRELYSRPATRFVAGFVGNPPMSLLTARNGGGPVRAAVPVPDGATLGVRAEDVLLGQGDVMLPVLAVEDHGNEVRVLLDADGERLLARAPTRNPPRVGDRVAVQVDPSRVQVFGSDGRAVEVGPAQ